MYVFGLIAQIALLAIFYLAPRSFAKIFSYPLWWQGMGIYMGFLFGLLAVFEAEDRLWSLELWLKCTYWCFSAVVAAIMFERFGASDNSSTEPVVANPANRSYIE